MDVLTGLPIDPGTAPAPDAVRDSPAPREADVAGLLGDLADEWRFFNHGALYSYGRFDADPLAELDVPVRLLRLRQPTFQGLGRSFGNVLLMTPSESWDRVFDQLRLIGIWDPETPAYREVRAVPVTLADPGYLAMAVTPSRIPRIDVTAFGFVGSDQTIDFQDGAGPFDPIRVVRRGPCDVCVRIRDAILAGTSDPLGVARC